MSNFQGRLQRFRSYCKHTCFPLRKHNRLTRDHFAYELWLMFQGKTAISIISSVGYNWILRATYWSTPIGKTVGAFVLSGPLLVHSQTATLNMCDSHKVGHKTLGKGFSSPPLLDHFKWKERVGANFKWNFHWLISIDTWVLHTYVMQCLRISLDPITFVLVYISGSPIRHTQNSGVFWGPAREVCMYCHTHVQCTCQSSQPMHYYW